VLAGVAAGWLPGVAWLPGAEAVPGGGEVLAWRSGVVAGLLATCVLAYDAGGKRTPLGPLLMGGCRFLNVLLGMSVAAGAAGETALATFARHELLVAAGLGLYVVGLTWFARHEAGQSRPSQLVPATVVMMAGIGILGLLHRNLPDQIVPVLRGEGYWWMLVGLLGFTILRRLSMAIADPSPRQVQWAVKHGILSLIMLDAAVALEVSHWSYALGIVALLMPTFLFSYWVYST
ncbi:MAG: hypothetical protein J5I93_18015, partial [Pirellulaceae bacterium]|nr:hypothetical protein [Pirellulaceae bacterium]